MKKILIVVALLALSFSVLCGCGGGGASGPSMPPGENTGIPSVVQLLPSTFIAQTNTFISLHTKVLDGNGIPLANIPVTFTNLSHPFGIMSSTVANTDAYGIATVTLYSTSPGFATILAQVNSGAGQVRDRKSVFFSTKDVLAVSMTLDVQSVPGDGTYNKPSDFIIFEPPPDPDNTVEVLATVFDAGGVPVEGGWGVSWSASHTEAKFIRTDTQTNLYGKAQAIVQITPESIRNTET
ncbi:MAG: Ig-like domain-containing protein, partial [Nitrospirota bacterium]|nr:Ig-like domain-containing protein [Nitrospirota bacterium]